MRRDLTRLCAEPHDVIVVGGGIHGACAAWEAARRGLRVALIEAGDFNRATSANSLRTLHGGLRHLQRLDFVHMRDAVLRTVPADSYTDFEWVAVERRFNGTPVEVNRTAGWAWFELDHIDPSRGASRDERDALRLVAMLIAHWDNKAENQRLVCQTPGADGSVPCDQPFALVHDLGATFGPSKIDLDGWSSAPIWADRARCIVSMKSFPYDGGTFRDAMISEAGRQLMTRQLLAITDRQMTALFTAARFPEFHEHYGRGADPNAWAEMLRRKIREIADGDPCPGSD